MRRLHLRAWGPTDGSRVVCLHGVTGFGGHFEQLAHRALASRRVLAPDLLGHGRSPSEPPWSIEAQVEAVLATVGTDGATWIGHSFGARLALEIRACAPEAVERLVLLDPAVELPPHVAELAAEGARRDRSYVSVEEAVDRRYDESVLHDAPRDLVAREVAAQLEQGADGRWRYRGARAAVVTTFGELATASPGFAEARVPTLLVLGRDSYVSYELHLDDHRRALESLLEVVTVPGGHTVLWDAFDEVATAIGSFVEG